jgi:hypothetical protein
MIEFLWLALAALFFTIAPILELRFGGKPVPCTQLVVRIALMACALFFLNLYLGEALR